MSNPNDAIRLKHLDSALQKINVLDTTPANVDGKLWFELAGDSIVVKMFYGGADFEFGALTQVDPTVAALVGDTILLGRRKIQLNGFAGGLTIYENTFYAANDTNHETPLGTVTFQRSVGGEILRCTIMITNSAALAGGDTVSIEQIAGDSISLVLILHGAGEIAGYWSKETVEVWGEEAYYYFYNSGMGGGYSKTNDTSYTRTSSSDTTSYKFYLDNFNETGIFAGGGENGNVNNVDNYVSVDEIRDESTGKLTKVVFNILDGSILKENGTHFVFNDDNVSNIPTAFKLSGNISPIAVRTTSSLTQDPDSKIYTYTYEEKRNGYYETTDNQGNGQICYYNSTQYGGDFCTIQGLADGLTLDGNYIKLNGTVVATLTVSEKDSIQYRTITIKDEAALATGYNTAGFTVTLTDTDYYTTGDRAHKLYDYKLAFDSTLTTPVYAKDTDGTTELTAKFTTSNSSGIYTYSPGTYAGYFKANAEQKPADRNWITSYSYVPQAQMEKLGLTLSGLRTDLSNFTVNLDGSIYSGQMKVGTIDFDAKTITIQNNALPLTPTDNSVISIGGDYTLTINGVNLARDIDSRIELQSGKLTYMETGHEPGFYDKSTGSGYILGAKKSYGYDSADCYYGFVLRNLDNRLRDIELIANTNTTNVHDGELKAFKQITAAVYNTLSNEEQANYEAYGTDYRTSSKQTVATITSDSTGATLTYTVELTKFAFNTDASGTTKTVTLVDNHPNADYVLAFADTDSRFVLDAANNTVTYTPS